MPLEALLADVRALRADSAMEYCNYLRSPGMKSYFQDIFGLQPTFTWSCGEDIPDCDKSIVPVQPSVESSSNASGSHCEIMTASRDKGSHIYGLGSVCTFPNRQSLQTVPAQACKHYFGKELTEPSNLSDYDVNACGYYRLPADSYAAIDTGEPEVTLAIHAVISGPTSARTGWEICFSKFGENQTTPSMQLSMDLEAMESELIQESNQASDDGALPHLGEQPTTPVAQAMLGATAVESLT